MTVTVASADITRGGRLDDEHIIQRGGPNQTIVPYVRIAGQAQVMTTVVALGFAQSAWRPVQGFFFKV